MLVDLSCRVASVLGNWEQKSICQNVLGESLCRLPFCEQGQTQLPRWLLPKTICRTFQLFLSLTHPPVILKESGMKEKIPVHTYRYIYLYLQPRGGWGSQEGVPLTKQPGLVLVKKCPGSKFPPTTAAAATQPAVCLSPLMLPFSLHFIPSRAVQL